MHCTCCPSAGNSDTKRLRGGFCPAFEPGQHWSVVGTRGCRRPAKPSWQWCWLKFSSWSLLSASLVSSFPMQTLHFTNCLTHMFIRPLDKADCILKRLIFFSARLLVAWTQFDCKCLTEITLRGDLQISTNLKKYDIFLTESQSKFTEGRIK